MRSFWDELPTNARWLLSTVAIQTLGRGLTLPFTLIYLHEVRGFDLGLSGTLMGLIAVSAFAVTGPGGTLTDRLGSRIMLLWGLIAMIAGNVVLAYATSPAVAGLALVLLGVNMGISWPAFNALIATVVSGDLRQRFFGVNFALVNLGIGVGGIIGGLYVDVARPSTFTTVFLAESAFGLVPMALLLGPLRHLRSRVEPPEDATETTYRAILRQPTVRWLFGLTFVGVFVGYGQLEAGFPGFGRQVAEVSTRTIGISFAVNTVIIVSMQFLVLSRITGHRRTRVLAMMSFVWAASWLVLGATGLVAGTVLASFGVLLFMAVFAFGETLMQPTIPAISNDLASDHTRGRYNAINAGAFQAGSILGPVAAGLLLGNDLSSLYIALMVAGCLGICVMALQLEKRIPTVVNGITESEPLETLRAEL